MDAKGRERYSVLPRVENPLHFNLDAARSAKSAALPLLPGGPLRPRRSSPDVAPTPADLAEGREADSGSVERGVRVCLPGARCVVAIGSSSISYSPVSTSMTGPSAAVAFLHFGAYLALVQRFTALHRFRGP